MINHQEEMAKYTFSFPVDPTLVTEKHLSTLDFLFKETYATTYKGYEYNKEEGMFTVRLSTHLDALKITDEGLNERLSTRVDSLIDKVLKGALPKDTI